jgi:hypothetical protein
VAKTRGQIEKQKRATEKRKQMEKAVLKIAAGMPDEDPKPGSTTPAAEPKATKDKP